LATLLQLLSEKKTRVKKEKVVAETKE